MPLMMRGPPGEPGRPGKDGKDGIPGKQLANVGCSVEFMTAFIKLASAHE